MTILSKALDQEATRLETVRRFASPRTSFRKGLDRIVAVAARQLGVPIAVVTLVDEDRVWFVARHGVDARETDRHGAFCAHTICQDGIFSVQDALRDPRFRDNPLVKGESKIRFYAGVPLMASNGQKVGSLCLMDMKPREPLTPSETTHLEDLAALSVDIFETCMGCPAISSALSEEATQAETKKRLNSAEQLLCLLFEYAPVSIAMFNRNMEYLAATRRWRETFKLGNQDIFGRSHYDVVPYLPERWKREYERCLAGEVVRWDQDYLQRADGTGDWLLRALHPWYNTNGEVGGIIVFNKIISKRKHAADDLERHRQFLNAVLESVQEGIVACDANGRLNVFNPAAKHMLNADAMDIPPSEWPEKYQIYEADGKTLLPMNRLPLIRALRDEIVEGEELVLAPENQEPRRVICNAQAMHVQDGAKIGAVVSMLDITDHVEIEARYRQAQKMEAVGQLTGGLAHDFNNLLAVILGQLQLLQRSPHDEAKSARRIAAAIFAAQQGAELTNRLLAFARKQTLEARPLDANKLIEELEVLLSRTLGEAIRLEIKQDPGLWTIRADDSQLQAAILNLAINARDAMDDEGRLTIETKNATLDEEYVSHHADLKAGDYVWISISDSGSGMSEEVRKMAFEPFFTTKSVGKGSGLGLSTVYGFIQQSGGHIQIDSREGDGTTVNMYFPRSFEAVDGDEKPWPHTASDPAAERILLVEDDAAVREVTAALLKDLGYRVTEAAGANAALDILQKSAGEFDLLITDVIMPGELKGPELARTVKKKFPHTAIMFISGFADAAILQKDDIEGSELVRKPFRREDLARKVRSVLNRRPQ